MTYDLEMLCIPKTEAKNLAWDSLRIIESWSQLQCQERVFDTEKGVEQAVVFFFFCVRVCANIMAVFRGKFHQ